MNLHFIRPECLLALIPLMLLLIALWRSQGARSAWKTYIAPHLAGILLTPSAKTGHHGLFLLSSFWIIGTLALAGPAINKKPLPVFTNDQGRVILMDMSASMYATDLPPNRLTQEKFRATDLINALKEGDTGLIAYAGDAFTISPMTNDRHTLLNLLPPLTPEIMPVQGSNLSAAVALAKKLLAQGGHHQGDIILLTDGVSATQFDKTHALLKGTDYRLAILSIGTEQGAPIRLPDGQLMRNNGEVIIAKTDYARLQKLANDSKGIMVPLTSDGSDINALTQWMDKQGSGDAKATDLKGDVWQDLGPYLALLMLIPALISFRSGILAALLVTAVYLPKPANAADWQDLWQTPNQQGQTAFDNKEYQQASKLFKDPNWQASAQYRAGNYQQALAGFEQDNSATGKYNQGNALMQLGDYAKAKQVYQAALKQKSDFPDAKANLELAEKLLKQQQQKNNQQNKDKQNQQGQQDKQSQKDQQGQQDKQNQQNQQGQQDKRDQQNQQGQQDKRDQKNQQGQQEKQNQQTQQGQQNKQDQQEQQNKSANDAQMQADASKQEPKPDPKQKQQTGSQAQQQAEKQPEQQKQDKAALAKAEQDKKDKQGEQQSFQAASKVPVDQHGQPLPEEMQRALRAVVDDPQILLRNKMLLEYQKRRMSGAQPKDNEQW